MICFDTGPLIWGIQKKAKLQQKDMIPRTEAYLKHLSEKKKRIMIPAPVLGEYLAGFKNKKDRDKQRLLIENIFYVPSFDAHTSAIFADIVNDRNLIKSIKEEFKEVRQSLRIDAQIIAIAIAQEAECIITHDPHFIKLAEGRISVKEVPIIYTQQELFETRKKRVSRIRITKK